MNNPPTDYTATLVERTVRVDWPNNERRGATPPGEDWQERAWAQEPTLHEIDEGSISGCSVLRWREDPRTDAELVAVSLALVTGKPAPAVPAGLVAVLPTTTDRDRIAEALYAHNHPGWAIRYIDLDQDERDTYLARADAVLAVLPAGSEDTTTTRANVLREAADRFDRYAEQLLEGVGELAVFVAKARRDQALVWREAARELRRLAAEAQPARSSCPDPIECGHEAALGQAQEEVRRLGLMVDEYGAGASALTDKLKRVRDLHHPASDWSWKPLGCQHDGEHGAPCRGCRGECWPCPTIRALDAASAGVQTDEETSR